MVIANGVEKKNNDKNSLRGKETRMGNKRDGVWLQVMQEKEEKVQGGEKGKAIFGLGRSVLIEAQE